MVREEPERPEKGKPTGEYITESVPRYQDARLTRWQLSPEELKENVEHYLKGEIPEWNERKGIWEWKRKGKRMMNDKGVKLVMTNLYPHIEKNTILSTLDVNEIAFVMKILHKHLVIHLACKWKEYEIDKHDLTMIVDIVTDPIWFAMKRAEGGAEKKFLAASEKRVERTIEREKGKKSIIPFVGD